MAHLLRRHLNIVVWLAAGEKVRVSVLQQIRNLARQIEASTVSNVENSRRNGVSRNDTLLVETKIDFGEEQSEMKIS